MIRTCDNWIRCYLRTGRLVPTRARKRTRSYLLSFTRFLSISFPAPPHSIPIPPRNISPRNNFPESWHRILWVVTDRCFVNETAGKPQESFENPWVSHRNNSQPVRCPNDPTSKLEWLEQLSSSPLLTSWHGKRLWITARERVLYRSRSFFMLEHSLPV